MGLDPAFSLTANDKNITSVLADRLVTLSVSSESDHQTDQLDLTLWDTDPHAPLIKPAVGAVLRVSLGYTGALVPVGSFVVSSLSGSGGKARPTVLSVQARAAPYATTPQGATDLQTQKTRSWRKGTTIGAIVQTMAKSHGMSAGVSPALAGIHVQHLDQTDESDVSFLQKLARHYDAIAKPAGGKLLFVARGDAQSASGKPIPSVTLTPAQVSSWNWNEDKHIAPGTVVALYHAHRTATTHMVALGSGDPVTRLRRKFRTEDDARAAATAEMRRRARGSVTLSVSLPGNPALAAGSAVLLDPTFRQGIEGRWIIKKARHMLSSTEGLKTDLECERANDDPAVQGYLNGQEQKGTLT